jgi:hypothetical protein
LSFEIFKNFWYCSKVISARVSGTKILTFILYVQQKDKSVLQPISKKNP